MLRSHLPEILTACAFLAGWLLVTWALAAWTWRVWPASIGLLCLSAGGWRLLWTIVTHGLYSLTREDSDA